MTPDELTLWQWGAQQLARQTGYVTKKPCADCPLAFRLAEYAAGRCCLPKPESFDDAERRRAYKAEWMRLARARAKGAQ